MKKKMIFIIAFCLLLFLVLWIYFGNITVGVTKYDVVSEEIPESFDGFRILQISDLHNDLFGEGESKLITKIAEAKPDIIVITGDFIDYYHTDMDIAVELLKNITEIAPVYYTTGNHESRMPEELFVLMEEAGKLGIHVLRNRAEYIEHEDGKIQLIGVEDPAFVGEKIPLEEHEKYIREHYVPLADGNSYKVLLCHRPEHYELYCELPVDIVFAGHAHGGQFRIPFIGGILAPSQGFFPKYSEGIHSNGEVSMIVSRGLGNSSFPFRFNNPPELILATLRCS